jgi:hypothetical protein
MCVYMFQHNILERLERFQPNLVHIRLYIYIYTKILYVYIYNNTVCPQSPLEVLKNWGAQTN